MVMDEPMIITQGAPLGCQKIRDHNRLAIAFGLWHWPAGLLSPHGLAAVVLIERGLIVRDENESER